MKIGPSEAETFWTSLLRTLAGRGRRGVKLLRRPRMHFSKGNLRLGPNAPAGKLSPAGICMLTADRGALGSPRRRYRVA